MAPDEPPPRPPPTHSPTTAPSHSQAASAAKAAEETAAPPAPAAPAVATSSPDALSRGGGGGGGGGGGAGGAGGGPSTTVSPRIRGDRLKAIVAEIERENSPAISKAPSRSFSYAAPVVVGAEAPSWAPSASAVHSPTTAPTQPLSTPPLQTPAPARYGSEPTTARYGSEPTVAPCTLATASHLPSEPHSPPARLAASHTTSMGALATPEAHGLMVRQLDQMQQAVSTFSADSPTRPPVSPSRSAAIQVRQR